MVLPFKAKTNDVSGLRQATLAKKIIGGIKAPKIKPEYIFPLLLILLDVGAAIIYALQKDYKKAVYWIAAAVLNVTVTF